MEFLQSTTARVLAIAFLALLFEIPLMLVKGLVNERVQTRQHAVKAIGQGWGGVQTIGPPVLAVPVQFLAMDAKGKPHRSTRMRMIMPDKVSIDTHLVPQRRHYGIFDTTVYVARVHIQGSFRARDLQAATHGVSAQAWDWKDATLEFPVADVHGIRALARTEVGGHTESPMPGNTGVARYGAIALPAHLASGPRDVPFDIEYTLAGTQALYALPLARETDLAMSAPWSDPGFNGNFLPATHKVDAHGFTAHWQVLDINRGYGNAWWCGDIAASRFRQSEFGTSLYQPADVYQANQRAGKYGVLFVALTFITFFLFEVLRKMRVHPVQYLLIGAALATFYLVLLALSEQIGFTAAYVCAAACVVIMVAGYAASILHARSAGMVLGGVLAGLYTLLYLLLVAQQYSLLGGALIMLALVAALMWLTRRVDWYRNDPAASARTPESRMQAAP